MIAGVEPVGPVTVKLNVPLPPVVFFTICSVDCLLLLKVQTTA